MKKTISAAIGACALVAGLAVGAAPAPAADHLEAPLVQQDGRTDINDLYVFQSPDQPDHTVLVMTVNPAAGVLSPTTFDPNARYLFQIDTDGDARQDETIRVNFGRVRRDGTQRVTYRVGFERVRTLTGQTADLADVGWATAGTFDDPFFFDFQAFQDQVKAAGGPRTFCDGNEVDFFAGLDTSAIVIQVPTDWLTGHDSTIGVWAETRDGQGNVIDRMGRPAIATVLVDDGSEDAYNATRPADHLADFGDQVRDNLLFLSGLDGTGYTEAEATAVTEVLLPDILTVDTAAPSGYLNGRTLADDVIDISLSVVTGGLGANGTPVLSSDCIDGNDVPFADTFPYLAPANTQS